MLVAVAVVIIIKRVVVMVEGMAMIKRAVEVVMVTVIMKVVVVLVRC